jgi:hypothetical protein
MAKLEEWGYLTRANISLGVRGFIDKNTHAIHIDIYETEGRLSHRYIMPFTEDGRTILTYLLSKTNLVGISLSDIVMNDDIVPMVLKMVTVDRILLYSANMVSYMPALIEFACRRTLGSGSVLALHTNHSDEVLAGVASCWLHNAWRMDWQQVDDFQVILDWDNQSTESTIMPWQQLCDNLDEILFRKIQYPKYSFSNFRGNGFNPTVFGIVTRCIRNDVVYLMSLYYKWDPARNLKHTPAGVRGSAVERARQLQSIDENVGCILRFCTYIQNFTRERANSGERRLRSFIEDAYYHKVTRRRSGLTYVRSKPQRDTMSAYTFPV